jgi:hypothetical protein
MVSKYGNPVSTPTFDPINKWGRMPKRKPAPDHSMWVCSVEEIETKARIAVGLVGPRGGADMLRDAILKQIELGKERRWADPQVVRVLA